MDAGTVATPSCVAALRRDGGNHRRRTGRSRLLVLLLLFSGCGSGEASHPTSDVSVPVGSAATSSLQLHDLDGRPVDPFECDDAKAIVFVFTQTDCPIANRYAPELCRLFAKYAPRHVAFWLIYPDGEKSVDAIRRHIADYEYPIAVLRDPDHALVELTGVSVTPEVAVFGSSGKLAYRGRIDDRYVDFGKARVAPTQCDLADTLDALLAGRQPTVTRTAAVGCPIPQRR